MSPLFRATFSWVSLVATIAFPGVFTSAHAQGSTNKHADSLLYRTDLQRVVDLQVNRDGYALRGLLADPDTSVRARAAFALGSVQDQQAVSALESLLQDPSRQVRADAAFALGQMPGPVSSQALLEALVKEGDAGTRRELLTALGKQGDSTSLVELVQLPLAGNDAAAAALTIGRYALRDVHAPEAVAWLVPLLHASDAQTRLNAAYYFGRSSRTEPWSTWAGAVRAALDGLALDDPAAMYLVTALGKLSEPEDTPRLLHWLQKARDGRIRVNAVRAIADRMEDEAVRAAFFGALADSVHHVALTAATALADAPEWTPSEAAQARNWIESNPAEQPASAPLLLGLARHGGDAAFVQEFVTRIRTQHPDLYGRYLAALAELSGGEVFGQLQAAAADPDVRTAYAAVDALSARWKRDRLQTGAPEQYFPIFAAALRRQDLATMYAAAPLLADSLFLPMGSIGVLEEVFARLRTPQDVEPMTAIIEALGETGSPDARPILEAALTHAHPIIRQAAARALQVDLDPDDGAAEPPERTVNWAFLRQMGLHPRLVLETEKGEIVIEMDAGQAPLTTQTLLSLAQEGQFDDVPFHRVVPNFVVQGGDAERGDGFGGPGFTIRSEFTRIPFQRGVVGMASAGKDTEGSQFFITHSMQPHLDGRYTAFGTVVDGMEVVDRLAQGDRILRAYVLAGEDR